MAEATNLNQTATGFQGCPVLGVGLGLRRPLLEDTLAATDLIDWLEFTPENYMGRGGKSLRLLRRAEEQYPLISHGVSLSLGSIDPISEVYLADLSDLFAWTNPAWFSDHLCFSSLNGNYFNDLMPLPRTWETVRHVASRVKSLQDRMQRPVLIENISQYLNTPYDEMPDAAFIAAILEQADCGLLLDVNNVYVNSVNHHFDAVAFLEALPLDRVVQIHVAGHHQFTEGLVDTHGAAVIEPVWDLLRWVLNRCKPCGVMLERDTYLPAFADLVPELKMIRQIWRETGQPETSSLQRIQPLLTQGVSMSLLEWQTRLSEALVLPQSPEVTRLESLSAVDASKLALYQELMFNTVRNTLQNIYPFTYALLSQQGKDLTSWNRLVEDYRRHFPNRSYKLMGAVSGFHQYLASQMDWMAQYPFLSDLALYEWLEMEVLNLPDAILPDTLKPEVPGLEDFSAFCPVWNPAKRLRAFGYNIPVLLDQLKQKQKNTPLEQVLPNPVDILIYRDPERLGVRFFYLNEMTASLIRLSVGCSYQEALLALQRELPILECVLVDVLQAQAQGLFQNCLQKGMLLGSVSV